MALTLTTNVELDIALLEGVGGANLHALDYLLTLIILKLDRCRPKSSTKLLELLGLSKPIYLVELITIIQKRAVHDAEGTLLHAKLHRIPSIIHGGSQV